MGSNYGPTIMVQKAAESSGFQQNLWLYGDDYQLTEVGAMNIFVFLKDKSGKDQLITPLKSGLILPGVTRDSILEMTRGWDEKNGVDFQVVERKITMSEVQEALNDGRLLEIFVVGTASAVCPVQRISFQGVDLNLPSVTETSLSQKILKSLTGIQYGEDPGHPWVRLVC